MAWGKLQSLELTDDEKLDAISITPSIANEPDYPYGTRICLSEKELEKLGLEPDCEIGDMIDMRCFGKVTSVSKSDTNSGSSCRVEIQITDMAVRDEMGEEGGD